MNPGLNPVSPYERRQAAQLYERARQALQQKQLDYAISLLAECCDLDPANVVARRTLRQTQRTKHGSPSQLGAASWFLTSLRRVRLRQAKLRGDHQAVLGHGEVILGRRPWDVPAQLAMATAAERLGLMEVAAVILELARMGDPREPRVARALALLYEKVGNYARAVPPGQVVAEEVPAGPDASRKVKALAASHTLRVGDYAGKALDEEGMIAVRRDAVLTPAEQERQHHRQRDRDIDKLKELVARQPTQPQPYLRLADLLRAAGEAEAARETLEQGLQATQRHVDIQMSLIDLEIDPCRENLRLTLRRLEDDPDDAALQEQRARWEKEVAARELAYFRQRADRSPSDALSRIEAAVRLRQLGKPKDAILELEPLKADERWGWRAWVELAECYVARRNALLARKHWDEALARLPADREAERAMLAQRAADAASSLQDEAAVRHFTELGAASPMV
ncbi:MAG TPA: hypothetical protein PKD86_18745 [Gemmatales bacterium]|nr:hypothetical protein [Gemmatales bacterium]